MELKGKVALVTGASRGIGAEIAKELSRRGCDLIITARTVDPSEKMPGSLSETATAIRAAGGEVTMIGADLTMTESVESLAAQALEWRGRVDVLVNNAAFLGRPMYENLDELSLKNWVRQLTVNLTAPFILAKAFVPGMRAAGGGAIVNITSGAWRMHESTVPGITYGPTKAAMNRWSIALARDLRPDNIVVFALEPGFVRTVLSEQHSWEAGIDIGRAHEAALPASFVGQLLARPLSEVTSRVWNTPQHAAEPVLEVDGTLAPPDGLTDH